MTDPLQPKRCAKILKVLADPDRLRIMRLLGERPRNVSDVADLLHLPVANASHHLLVLRRAEFIEAHKQGRFVVYQIRANVLQLTDSAEYLNLGCCRLEMPRFERVSAG